VGLKILAETRIVAAGVTPENFSDLMLLADAKGCALLRERCVDHYVLNAREVRRHPSHERVRESAAILGELVDALLARPARRSRARGDEDADYDTIGVDLLRKTLDGRGLDVDGSREVLVRRLRSWDGRKGGGGGDGFGRGTNRGVIRVMGGRSEGEHYVGSLCFPTQHLIDFHPSSNKLS
jgi:hypothetical protein